VNAGNRLGGEKRVVDGPKAAALPGLEVGEVPLVAAITRPSAVVIVA